MSRFARLSRRRSCWPFPAGRGRRRAGAHEGGVDQRAEARIGEDLLPGEAAEVGGGVGRIRAFLAVKAVGNLGNGFVFGVNAATAECQRGGKGYD